MVKWHNIKKNPTGHLSRSGKNVTIYGTGGGGLFMALKIEQHCSLSKMTTLYFYVFIIHYMFRIIMLYNYLFIMELK